jgi:PBP1b-binding outer membrane lipoprotein LpoB
MKTKSFAATALAAVLLAGCATRHHHEDQAALQAEAKVSRADAEKIALAKAPNGTVKEGELEKEKGKLIWSFDLTTPDSKDITEVNVDAITGEVVSVEKEAAKEHEKEKGEDAKKEKDKD